MLTTLQIHPLILILAVVKGLQIWTDDEKQMIPEQIPLSEYKGQLNVTVSGKYCNGSNCQEYKNLGFLHCLNTDGVSEECSVNCKNNFQMSLVGEYSLVEK